MQPKRFHLSLYFILFVAFLLLPSVCFASFDATFKQTPVGLLVSLSETNFWRHSDDAIWMVGESSNIPNPNYYYDNQILCSVELENNGEGGNLDINLSAELLSNEWCYTLNGNDSKYKRPFGIQIMARGQMPDGSYRPIGHGVSMGGTVSAVTGNLSIPENMTSSFAKVIFDVVLVFDKNVDTLNDSVYNADGTIMYPLIATDSYYSSVLRLTASNGMDRSTYDVHLSGYYGAEDSQATSTIMSNVSVSQLSSVDDIVAKDVFANNSTVEIASYSYSTNSVQGRRTGMIALSLSSESNDSGMFILKHVNSNGGTSSRITSHNSMNYYVELTSDNGYSSKDSEKRTVRFDGTLSYPFDADADYIIIPANTFMNALGTKTLTNWIDSGTIAFSIPSTQMINGNFVTYDGLVSGKYTTNIYLNIITDC